MGVVAIYNSATAERNNTARSEIICWVKKKSSPNHYKEGSIVRVYFLKMLQK